MYPQYPQQPGQQMYPQQPQYAPQPQQYQPYGVQPQQQPMQQMSIPMPSQFDIQNALAQYVMRNANQTQVGAYLYQRGSQSNWQDPESFGAARIAQALVMHQLRMAPGMQPQQALNIAIQQIYEVMIISALSSSPQMVQGLPPNILQGLLQNLPQLQQTINQAMQAAGMQGLTLQIPGYTVQAQQQFQPIAPGLQMTQYQQVPQANLMQQYGSPMVQQRQDPNMGLSNARAVTPPPAGDAHFGAPPIDLGKLNVGVNRVQQEDESVIGIKARKINYGPGPNIEPRFKDPVQQPTAPVQQPQYVPEQPANWNGGVVESHATPTLAEAIRAQLQQDTQPGFDLAKVPSDIAFDSVMSIDSEEESALFDAPSDGEPMPSMTELFGKTFGQRMMDPMSGVVPQVPDVSTYTHHLPQDQVVDLTAGQTTVPMSEPTASAPAQVRPLSEDGLPDGWLYTEAHYEADSTDFYNVMMKAKRHKTCPWPIGYDRRYCTRLYRYMEDGSIEQKIVGVPMDRLKHDISLLTTPTPTEDIRQAELAEFGPLTSLSVGEAVKIVKDPEVTPEIIDEKLGDKSIYVVDKPIYALSRQEAVLLSSLKIKPLSESLPRDTHGFETQIREITLVTAHPELKAFLENDHIAMLTQDSTAKDLMEISEAIRAIRTEGLLPDRCLRKITEHMREVLNLMLYADYAYGGTIELEDEQNFEDELVEFIMYMNKTEENLDVLDRIHKNWDNVRGRLCTVLTGKALESAQQQIARRYTLPDDESELMLKQMKNAVLLQSAYSITTIARTTKQLRVVDNQPAFVTMASERPYLHQLMTDVKKRSKASGAIVGKHYLITSDGVELGFSQAGLGNGNTFPTYYIN
jgi:hypothetical protein